MLLTTAKHHHRWRMEDTVEWIATTSKRALWSPTGAMMATVCRELAKEHAPIADQRGSTSGTELHHPVPVSLSPSPKYWILLFKTKPHPTNGEDIIYLATCIEGAQLFVMICEYFYSQSPSHWQWPRWWWWQWQWREQLKWPRRHYLLLQSVLHQQWLCDLPQQEAWLYCQILLQEWLRTGWECLPQVSFLGILEWIRTRV